MADKKDSDRVKNAADKLDHASREATFAAKVQLTRATGKKATELDPGQVKRVAEPIYQNAAAELIAGGSLDLPTSTRRTSHTTREERRRGAKQTRPTRQNGADLKSLLHTHAAALDKLGEGADLSAADRKNVREFFKAAHPRMSAEPVVKARGNATLSPEDQTHLAGVVKKDRNSLSAAAKRRSQPKDPDQPELALKGGGPRKSHAAKVDDARQNTSAKDKSV